MDVFMQEVYSRKPVVSKRTHGFDIFLNSEDRGISPSIGVLGWYELRTTEIFTQVLSRGDCVVDVGANVGFFSLLAARIVGQEGKVVSLEPEPTSFSLLSKSVQGNNFSNVLLLQKCASDVDGEKRLFLSTTNNKGTHTIAQNLGGPSLTVPSVRLDSQMSQLGIDRIDMLKIDAEGAEPEILIGAEQLLSRRRIRNMIIEWDRRETWLPHKDQIVKLFPDYEGYLVSRSLPFLPITKLDPGSPIEESFHNKHGTNLYLRLRG